MRHAIGLAALTLAFAASMPPASACLNDRETLIIERRGLPQVMHAIVGALPTHADAVYRARVAEIQAKWEMGGGHTGADYDDIALAHLRLGDLAEAERLLRFSLGEFGRRYETLANLGTVLIYGGQTDAGRPLIEEAIRINPNAHFGRERMQLALIDAMQAARRSNPPTPAQLARYFDTNPGEPDAIKAFVGIIATGGAPQPPVYWGLALRLQYESLDEEARWARLRLAELLNGADSEVYFARGDATVRAAAADARNESGSKSYRLARRAAVDWLTAFHNWEVSEVQRGSDPSDDAQVRTYLALFPIAERLDALVPDLIRRSTAPAQHPPVRVAPPAVAAAPPRPIERPAAEARVAPFTASEPPVRPTLEGTPATVTLAWSAVTAVLALACVGFWMQARPRRAEIARGGVHRRRNTVRRPAAVTRRRALPPAA